MARCPDCDVELEPGLARCPLCLAPVEASPADAASTRPGRALPPDWLPKPPPGPGLSPRQRGLLAVEILTVVMILAAAVSFAVDVLSGGPRWSPLVIVCLGFTWLLACIPIILFRHPWLIFTVLGPTAPLFLFLVDVFDDGRINWFLLTGLPILLLAEAFAVIVPVLIAGQRRKGLNSVAVAMLGASVFCLGLEMILNLNYGIGFRFTWSAVVASALIPTACLFFYLHARVARDMSFRKMFNL